MSSSTRNDILKDTIHLPDLVRALLAHLEQEVVALDEVGAVLRSLNQALRKAAHDEVETLRCRHQTLAERLDALRAARAELVGWAARSLGVAPADFTLRQLIGCLPGNMGRQLEASRERTRRLALDVHAWNRRNAALIRSGLAFVGERLQGLSCESRSGRYSASGKTVNTPQQGSLFEVQG